MITPNQTFKLYELFRPLVKTEEEAKKTVEDYKIKYKEGKSPYDSPNYKKSEDNIHYIVYNESTGKVLKSINYTPVKF